MDRRRARVAALERMLGALDRDETPRIPDTASFSPLIDRALERLEATIARCREEKRRRGGEE